MLGPVELVDEVDSTNRVLLDRARAGASHGLVLVANHQTAGRGRLDRRWEAAPGTALLVSVLLRPAIPSEHIHLLTLAAAVAAVDACANVARVNVGLKWPNDVVAGNGNRKLAGVLAESLIEGGAPVAVVVGMGLNLRGDDLPEGAVALADLTSDAIDRDLLLTAWLSSLESRCESVGTASLLADYRALSTTIGQRVLVDLGAMTLEGVALDLADDGALIVDVDGDRVAVRSGDVIHLRRP